ncbi:MAG: PcfB family protein [Eubacterium sp.]|nr:PcfB family protein [Eubacterium sp.]
MDSGAQAADTVVRFALTGTVFFLKITGQATATLISFLAAATAEKSKTAGKVRLKSLLQSGSELKVFTVQGKESFQEFVKEAKRYGMLFSVVKRTQDDRETGVYDIMVRAEDASKLNRIIERHHMAEVNGTAKAVEAPEAVADRKQTLEARDLLTKMMEQDADGNPGAALEGPSRSNARYRMPNQANRRSVIKEVESYTAEGAEAAKPKQAAIMPNLMQGESDDEEKKQSTEREQVM